MQVGRRSGKDLLVRVELEMIDGGDLGRSDKLGGVGKSPEVNDEAGRAKSVSITGVVEVGGRSE